MPLWLLVDLIGVPPKSDHHSLSDFPTHNQSVHKHSGFWKVSGKLCFNARLTVQQIQVYYVSLVRDQVSSNGHPYPGIRLEHVDFVEDFGLDTKTRQRH